MSLWEAGGESTFKTCRCRMPSEPQEETSTCRILSKNQNRGKEESYDVFPLYSVVS